MLIFAEFPAFFWCRARSSGLRRLFLPLLGFHLGTSVSTLSRVLFRLWTSGWCLGGMPNLYSWGTSSVVGPIFRFRRLPDGPVDDDGAGFCWAGGA